MTAPAWLTARPIAHRGLHGHESGTAENTAAAAEAAISGGYAIECDVQISADGEAMVFHDHDLDRLTTASGPVRERRAETLARMRVGGTADTIPTLEAFLDHIGGRTPLVVEIKSRFDGDLRLAQRTAAILSGWTAPVAVKSFDPEVVACLREVVPALPRGIVAEASYASAGYRALALEARHAMANLLHWDRTEPDFLSWRFEDLGTTPPFLARRLGHVPVMAWTIRDARDVPAALAGADQIVFEGFRPDAVVAPV